MMTESCEESTDPLLASDGPFSGYVVAIGASAGGLDALERFFAALPVDTGAAYVVVQHLSPDYKSMMANLLARHTRMPVVTVVDEMRLRPDRVHLIPPASLMSMTGDALRLSPKNPRVLTLPIDLFFSSLAAEIGPRAIAVVLSGTGSDGTRGAVAINDAGGLLLAQEPESAKFDGMPRSVIATGLVDAILAPEELGPRIIEHLRQLPTIKPSRDVRAPGMDDEYALEEAMHLLQHRAGINFRDYKPATVMRRIGRRMQVRHTPNLANYVQLLDTDQGELALLRRELLIPVTSFFRDPEAFETLAETAIKTIMAERGEGQPLRVWVPGASTGEEAYSLAILFAEAFDRARRWPGFKLFATDVEQQHVDAGSAGVFSEAIAAELSSERLERFFERRDNHFVVRSELRQNIVFARHNLLEDPPFTRMDLVSCRNLLIYFRSAAQTRALRRIQYALAPGGFLLLGLSETLADLQADFTSVSAKYKIYRVLRRLSLPLDGPDSRLVPRGGLTKHRRSGPQRGRLPASDAAVIEAGQAALLSGYAPTSLLLNSRLELLHLFGDVGAYLRISQGNATLDVSRLLAPSLVAVAQALLYKAMRSGTSLRSDLISLERPGQVEERLRLVARPLDVIEGETHLILSFEPEPEPSLGHASSEISGMQTLDLGHETAHRIESLERELSATRESLQATIEELETANEELQATNEELMASNEELQSSNEELQSVNEELYTVNAENQEKIEILNRLNADLDSMAKAAGIATIFVDAELHLTRFTPEATSLFKIRGGDLGRAIDDFTNLLQYPAFVDELRQTISSGEMLQRELQAANGRVYLVRVLPYAVRTGDRRGAVATFVDITILRDIDRLQAALDALPEQVAVLDPDGVISLVNRAWRDCAAAHGDREPTLSGPGVSYLERWETRAELGEAHARAVRDGIRGVLDRRLPSFFISDPDHSPSERGWFAVHVAPIHHPDGGVIVSHLDTSLWLAADSQGSRASGGLA